MALCVMAGSHCEFCILRKKEGFEVLSYSRIKILQTMLTVALIKPIPITYKLSIFSMSA